MAKQLARTVIAWRLCSCSRAATSTPLAGQSMTAP